MTTQSTPRLPIPAAEQRWMQELEKSLWDHGDAKRKLEPDEFTCICELVTRHELPCELLATGPINGFTLIIYNHPPVFGVKPDVLLRLGDDHHPLEEHGPEAWKKILAAYAELSNNPRNEQLARYYKLRAPKPLSHYEY
ncbi:MAG: hypothetical protein WCV85_01405 [Patescibacteria group bacterium]